MTPTEYLGHFITKDGVSTGPTKIQVVGDWSLPQNISQLRGFLELVSYCRRFVKDFVKIARPLIEMLKKKKKITLIGVLFVLKPSPSLNMLWPQPRCCVYLTLHKNL